MSDRLGEVIDGKYRLVELLGRGGMGEVYQAEHTVINRSVAVKLLRARHADNSLISERFLREAKAASAIGHRNIVEIYDVGRTGDGSIYIVMERLRGRSLADLLREEAPLTTERAVEIALEVLEGLRAAHDRGIIHRDLKPDNVFMIEGRGVKLLDFGISKMTGGAAASEELTETGVALGTPAYMAPEQIQSAKDADGRTDLWAVGVMLFLMLSGRPPFVGDNNAALLASILFEPPLRLADLIPEAPPEMATLIERALSKDPDDRFPSAPDMAEALRRCSLMPGAPAETLSESTKPDDGGIPFAPEESSKESKYRHAPAESRWLRVLWYGLTMPLAFSPVLLSFSDPSWTLIALGLPPELPSPLAWAIAATLCVGLVIAALRVERSWRFGGDSPWLQGPLFVVFPATGLALSLVHFLTLRGRTSSYALALHSYTELDAAGARELSGLIANGNEGFLKATALDHFTVSVLALIVLLGFLFVRPEGGPPSDRRWMWAILPVGLVLILIWQLLLFPLELGMMGIWTPILYGFWALIAVVAIRLRARSVDGGAIRGALVKGVVVMAAQTGVQIAMGYIESFDAFLDFPDDLAPGDLEWLYDVVINPLITTGFAAEWGLFALLLVMTALACRPRPEAGGLLGSGWGEAAVSLAIILATALPLAMILSAMDQASLQFTALKVAGMEPAALGESEPRSFYIDRRPQSLYAGRRGLLAAITEERRRMHTTGDELLRALDDRRSCGQLLEAALRPGPEAEPARCVTGIEARRYCEGLGKRLPTPDEWDGAVAPGRLERGPFGEWTMGEVHGTPTFEVRGGAEPLRLPPDEASPDVGFRCAWSFGD
jgi:serine/threonine protein kinase